MKGIAIFKHNYLYSAYADDTTFFLRDKISITFRSITITFITFLIHLLHFQSIQGLKPNHEKCKISGIGVLKSVEVAVCGMKCIDLCNDTIKLLGSTFRTTRKSEMKKIFWRA